MAGDYNINQTYSYNSYPNFWWQYQTPQPCPTCNRCPTCGTYRTFQFSTGNTFQIRSTTGTAPETINTCPAEPSEDCPHD
jgi:hypothetical protein